MTHSPQKLREATLQLLYSQEDRAENNPLSLELLSDELALPLQTMAIAQEKVALIHASLAKIDGLIASVSTEYDVERIHTITRHILRLAIYELLIEKTLPPKVVIAEAIRLSRKFGSPESASFVNALLDKLYKGA